MIKPKRLKQGDKAAIVSLSSGILGDDSFIHKYTIAKERLEHVFGLQVTPMPHALKGSQFVADHPELRAKDLMDAFLDDSISAVFCAIGGDDTIRTLPFIDLTVLREHPKIFMGYSDSTINHLMMYKAGLTSFYGPSVMCEFGEYLNTRNQPCGICCFTIPPTIRCCPVRYGPGITFSGKRRTKISQRT